MKEATDNFPVVEPSARGLGVREPPSPDADMEVDAHSNVVLNGRGMSVARHWRDLPLHRIPKRLAQTKKGARAPNSNYCWRMGDGPFQPAPVTVGLDLVLKPYEPNLGNIVPSKVTTLTEFQRALAATRSQWAIDET